MISKTLSFFAFQTIFSWTLATWLDCMALTPPEFCLLIGQLKPLYLRQFKRLESQDQGKSWQWQTSRLQKLWKMIDKQEQIYHMNYKACFHSHLLGQCKDTISEAYWLGHFQTIWIVLQISVYSNQMLSSSLFTLLNNLFLNFCHKFWIYNVC